MIIRLDSKTGVPIYLQIINEIKGSILSGSLVAGEKLPSVRELAMSLKVNPNTIAKSYRELKHDGVIESQWGGGYFVASDIKKVTQKDKEILMSKAFQQLINEAKDLGFNEKEQLALFKKILNEGEWKK
jgi:GntR family transcriptional regulator